jgi:ribosomal protein S18 acetylase RimI-like enzyme
VTADADSGAPIADAAVPVDAPIGATVEVYEATEVTDELVEAFARLIPQLSSSSAPTSRTELAEITSSEADTLFMARDGDGLIVGSLKLAVFRIPTGVRAWIEDVVVDDSARGAGVGEALVEAAVERARSLGAKTVDLTSRPSREAANRLYVRTGFVARTTNVYRRSLEGSSDGSQVDPVPGPQVISE